MIKLDYLIIGAGPAGLQMAYHFEKSKKNYLLIEKSDKSGSFFSKFPRHRKLISINKVYTGTDDPEVKLRWDWNSILSDDQDLRLEKYSKEYFPGADSLVNYLNEYAEKFELNISYNSEVTKVSKINDQFIVEIANGTVYQTKILVVGTGIFKPYTPDIKGIELCENYVDCSVDPNDYINKRVLIIGKGNSGFETADNLVEVASTIHIASPNSLKFAWQTHFVGHLRAVNNNMLDTYQLKSQNAVLDAKVRKIEKRDDKYFVTYEYAHANGEIEEISYDRVIIATGFKFDASIYFDDAKPNLAIDSRFPEQTYEWESVNVKNMYFIGAVTQQRDYKSTTSAFIHGFRYNVACLAEILDFKYEKIPFQTTKLDFSAKNATNSFMTRINKTSSLWQQFGFLGDLIVVDPQEKSLDYLETIPVDYILQSNNWKDKHQFILTMEYGEHNMDEDVFGVNRIRRDEVDVSHQSKFLHPIVRHYHQGELVSEFHMIEVLEAQWTSEEMHTKPLFEYMQKEMAAINKPELVEENLIH